MASVTICSYFGAQENKGSHCFHCFPMYLPWSAGTRCHGLCLFVCLFSFIFISCRLITLQYCSGFCHTLTWISHGYTCIPHPDPPSHLPLHPIPLGLPSAPCPSTCLMHPTWAGDLFHPWCFDAWSKTFLDSSYCYTVLSLLSRVWLFVTQWTVAARLICLWGFSRQEYCSGLPCPPPGDLPNPGIKPKFPTSQSDSLTSEPQEKPMQL